MNKKTSQAKRIAEVREHLERVSSATRKRFDACLRNASEAVLIGSFALGTPAPASDVDILFVGSGTRYKDSSADFIWISPQKLRSRSWLGSEFANHVSKYGVWLKGRGNWRARVFFSPSAVRQKSERILLRLTRIYCKRRRIRPESLVALTRRCVLDMQRLLYLRDGKPVPSLIFVVKQFLQDPRRTLDEACAPELLGDLGKFFVHSFIPISSVVDAIRITYDERKRSAR